MKLIDDSGEEYWVVTKLYRQDIIDEAESQELKLPKELTDERMEEIARKIEANSNFMNAFWEVVDTWLTENTPSEYLGKESKDILKT